MFTSDQIANARSIIHEHMPPTPQYAWPLLQAELGLETWVKHENHTPTGAFKVRGGLVHIAKRVERGETNGVITATRGNHGQSIPYAASRNAIASTIVVPHGNSVEKNAAIKAQGAELIETGADFDEARLTCEEIAKERGLDMIPSFHRELVLGVSTYAHELFEAAGELDAVYVPIGMGSGCCGVISARDHLGLNTKVIAVVSENANCYKLSVEAGRAIETNSATTFADGMAVRVPHPDALEIISKGVDSIVEVSDDEVADAIRLYFRATHNVAEGAGAAPLAALTQQRETMKGKRVGVILCGGNIDTGWMRQVLAGETPVV
jgi:threonine dehydratase